MGPVSFEAISVGSERVRALEAAAIVRRAGLRFDLLEPADGVVGAEYRLMLRSHDLLAAIELLARGGHGEEPSR